MKAWRWLVASLCVLGVPQLSVAQSAAPAAIADARFVMLGGIEQWITIRGKDAKAPVLLWVHGGPTNIQSPFVSVYEPLTEHFTLVQWDQRGAGKTYLKNPGPPEAVSLEQIARDGIELVEYLQKRLSVPKIILAGHSWGSLVGVEMAKERPELFDAFIGAGQVNSWRDTVKWQYEYAVRKAREAGDTAVVDELEKAGLPPHDDRIKYFAMRRRFAAYLPKVDADWIAGEQTLYAAEPGVTPDALKAYAAAGAFSGARLLPAIMATNLSSNTSELRTRVCVIQGELDTFTPTPVARPFYDQIRAPKKFFGVIPNAGHFAAMTHTGEFLKEVRQCLAT